MKLQELQDKINDKLSEEKKIPTEVVLDNFLKREGFIHLKELTFVLKSKETSVAIYNSLKTRLPESTLEICSSCENIINYYIKKRIPYTKCPRCEHQTDNLIITKIMINFHYLSDDRKIILIEDLREKIKNLNLEESLSELTQQEPKIIADFIQRMSS